MTTIATRQTAPPQTHAVAVLGPAVGSRVDLCLGFFGDDFCAQVTPAFVARVAWWLTPANHSGVTPKDIGEAVNLMLAPATLAKLQYGVEKFLGVFAECVERAMADRTRRQEREAERQRKVKYAAEPNIRERAKVVGLLAGIGTRVGKGRPTTPTRADDGDESEGQAGGEEGDEEGDGEGDGRHYPQEGGG